MVSPSLQIQYAAQVALQRCLILRIDKAYLLYHFPYYLSIVLISNSIFCPTLRVRFTQGAALHSAEVNNDIPVCCPHCLSCCHGIACRVPASWIRSTSRPYHLDEE